VSQFKGWGDTLDATIGFFLGIGPTENLFEPGSEQAEQMHNSFMGESVDAKIEIGGWKDFDNGDSGLFGLVDGHIFPFMASFAQPLNGTQASVGGFLWNSMCVGKVMMVHVTNTISLKSLLYDRSFAPNFQRTASGFGPFGDVNQDFHWYLRIRYKYRLRNSRLRHHILRK
jgi:hypothetical protein